MNWWWILLGILLIAAGTGSLTLGTIFVSRNDAKEAARASDKQLDAISKDLAELRGRPKSQISDGAIAVVEGEVKKWAEKFASERQHKQLQAATDRADNEAQTRHANMLARDYTVFFVTVLNDSLAAYAEATGTAIDHNLPKVPPNLFSDDEQGYETSIHFSPTISWKLAANSIESPGDVAPPWVLIYLRESVSGTENAKEREVLMLRFSRSMQTFHLRLQGHFAQACGFESTSKPISEYENAIKTLVKNILESQLLQ